MIDESSVSCAKITIDAPADVVWGIIVDFDRYGEWNEFCPHIQARGELEIGTALEMKVELGRGLQEQVEYITCIEAPHKIVWSMRNLPDDPIHASRTQLIEPIDDTSCTYWSIDEFEGPAVEAMMKVMAEPVERGFELCARGLKREAERQFESKGNTNASTR